VVALFRERGPNVLLQMRLPTEDTVCGGKSALAQACDNARPLGYEPQIGKSRFVQSGVVRVGHDLPLTCWRRVGPLSGARMIFPVPRPTFRINAAPNPVGYTGYER
jgi:hypothetical protein